MIYVFLDLCLLRSTVVVFSVFASLGSVVYGHGNLDIRRILACSFAFSLSLDY